MMLWVWIGTVACIFSGLIGWVACSDSVGPGVRLLNLPVPGRPLASTSVLPSVGGSISANPIEWSFFTVIVVPLFSCDSTLKTAAVFNEALRRMNPGVTLIRSTPLRLDSDVCIDGECFCEEPGEATDGRASVRVIEVETVCSSDAMRLPPEAEFPFEYDTRDSPSPLSGFAASKGRML